MTRRALTKNKVAISRFQKYLVHLHAEAGDPLHVLCGQVGLAVLLALSQCYVQRLGDDDAAVHLSDGLGGLFRRRKAHETESLEERESDMRIPLQRLPCLLYL